MKTALLTDKIFNIHSDAEFENLALEIFREQYENNKVYGDYVKALGIDVAGINKLTEIPFLPITFFKSHQVVCGSPEEYEAMFKSSSTTGAIPSKHYVKDISLYKQSFRKGFEYFYPNLTNPPFGDKGAGYCLLALLPSYLERGDSSLVYMAEDLIKESGNKDNGFYMNNYEELIDKLIVNEKKARPDEPFGRGQKTLLLGVTYALLDLAEKFPMELKYTIIMETGGMKGRREELTRPEVHKILKDAFKVKDIHSEYGMTELLSQAYSKGNGIFQTVPWMKVLIRDVYDPFLVVGTIHESSLHESPVRGAINIIDLANIHSCSFIATDDLGVLYPNGEFEVAGRLDSSDIRGCNLMTLAPL